MIYSVNTYVYVSMYIDSAALRQFLDRSFSQSSEAATGGVL